MLVLELLLATSAAGLVLAGGSWLAEAAAATPAWAWAALTAAGKASLGLVRCEAAESSTTLVSTFSTGEDRDMEGGSVAARLFSASDSAEDSEAAVAGEVAGEAADLPQSGAVAAVSGAAPGTLSTLLVSLGLVSPSCWPRGSIFTS